MLSPWTHIKAQNDPFAGNKVNYPVSFDLKIIIAAINSNEENIAHILAILNNLAITHEPITSHSSKTGKYISYNVKINVINEHIFHCLYTDLRAIPHLKTAI